MRILLETHHPSDIHFFKFPVKAWIAAGHEVRMLGRDRDVMNALGAAYSYLPYRAATKASQNNRFPLSEMLARQGTVAKEIINFRPQVVASLMGSYTQSAQLLRIPSLIFTDSEHQSFNHRIAHPFATEIHTPACFHKELGKKQRRYAGYHELSYLRPERFSPDPTLLQELGVERRGYIVVRTSAWNTLHDIGASGLGPALLKLIPELAQKFRIFIIAEQDQVPEILRPYALSLKAERLHDLLAFARLVISEGASTASEAICLGTPVIYANSLSCGYLEDQERRYGTLKGFRKGSEAISAIHQELSNELDESLIQAAKERLLNDHIDVAQYVEKAVIRVGEGKA